jgi:transposase
VRNVRFTVLASVIETCRQRGHLPWTYIAEALRLRRQGNAVSVPPPAVA